MYSIIQMAITVVCSVLASSGFWAYIQKRTEKNDVRTQMLIGLGHDRIVSLGMKYIERGYITRDEYENLYDYLYKCGNEIINGTNLHVGKSDFLRILTLFNKNSQH